MDTKKFLTAEQVDEIIKCLESEQFEESHYSEFQGKTSSITVYDDCYDDEPVSAHVYYDEDGPRSSAAEHITTFEVNIEGFVFTYQTDEGEWKLKSEEFALPEDVEVCEKLIDALDEAIYTEPDYDYYVSFDEEWTKEEIIKEITRQLQFPYYLKVDDEIYKLPETTDELIEKFFDAECEDSEECKESKSRTFIILNKQAAAKELSQNLSDD